MADIIVYGGGFAAVAAAAKAASNAPQKNILLVAPYPTAKLGGIATIGGQNYWDTRDWNGMLVEKGSFEYWYDYFGGFYNTDEMAALLLENLDKYPNVEVLFQYDIFAYSTSSAPYQITSVKLKNIYRDTDCYIKWGKNERTETVSILIDASEDGRIARTVNTAVTTGRYDWPSEYLDTIERNSYFVGRQQAVTLMFKMKGIIPGTYADMNFSTSANGVNECWGGSNTYKTNDVVVKFNNTYGAQGYVLKPINAAQNGNDSDEWWINALLIFNVDGRLNYRDIGTVFYPQYILSGSKSTDEAWISARNFLKNNADFLTAIQQFDGFSKAEFVCENNYPVVGDILYLRETVHMSLASDDRKNGSENNYAITTDESNFAGTSPTTGADIDNYATRIGLAYYNSDIHPFTVHDLKDENGCYIWGTESYCKMRPDLNLTAQSPINPMYVPYNALTTNYVANVLLPGYAVGVSSFSWGETRVFPNLSVLGDAAGVTAAYCLNNGKQPLYLDQSDISNIQNLLITVAEARLDK